MPGEEGSRMGDAYRGHGVQHPKKLDADRQTNQALRGLLSPRWSLEQLAEPGNEGAGFCCPAREAIHIEFDP
ncbi:hypothetical protein D3C73_1558710 [compost metagenome]